MIRSRSVWLTSVIASCLVSLAHAQAQTPEDHPGFALAQAIAAQGCVLHQDDVNALLEGVSLTSQDFPQMALPLIQSGILASTGNGSLTQVNWGLCTDEPTSEADGDDGTD